MSMRKRALIPDWWFIEAHGSGTLVGDPQEANALVEVFCAQEANENDENQGQSGGRSKPLLVGSVK